jgi:hypothetical protein
MTKGHRKLAAWSASDPKIEAEGSVLRQRNERETSDLEIDGVLFVILPFALLWPIMCFFLGGRCFVVVVRLTKQEFGRSGKKERQRKAPNPTQGSHYASLFLCVSPKRMTSCLPLRFMRPDGFRPPFQFVSDAPLHGGKFCCTQTTAVA